MLFRPYGCFQHSGIVCVIKIAPGALRIHACEKHLSILIAPRWTSDSYGISLSSSAHEMTSPTHLKSETRKALEHHWTSTCTTAAEIGSATFPHMHSIPSSSAPEKVNRAPIRHSHPWERLTSKFYLLVSQPMQICTLLLDSLSMLKWHGPSLQNNWRLFGKNSLVSRLLEWQRILLAPYAHQLCKRRQRLDFLFAVFQDLVGPLFLFFRSDRKL